MSIAAKRTRWDYEGRIPLRITDTTLRDAHQSLWATRMRTEDMLGIVEVMDNTGFYSLEVWGGATFDVCLRFLKESPWDRLRAIKSKAKKTPLQMLLRGQNVVGYKNYADDLVDRFVALACQNGVDIFRVFDALNDTRNLESAIKAVKRHGGHAQGTICYTISPVHTIEKFVKIAKEQVEMGIDSLCIKDMAGFLSPIQSDKLISALVRAINVPIQMHCHATSGMAVATYVEGVRAGAGAIDCAISAMAGFSSQPPVETMASIFSETSYHANLDPEGLKKMCKYFSDLAKKRRPEHHPENIIDPDVLLHHIPGGMISNLRSQLEQQNALDKLDTVLHELPLVREDLGFPPLVTPTSQIIGVQAVMNVLAGERYGMVPQETKNYVKGLYGRSPARINPNIKKKILGKEKAIEGRPADLLEPMLPNATKNIDADLIKGEEDIISYCLFPEQALEYFKWRKLPADKRPPTPADVEEAKRKQAKPAQAAAAAPEASPAQPAKPLMTQTDYSELKSLLDKVNQLQVTELSIKRNDLNISLKASASGTPAPVAVQAPVQQAAPVPEPVKVEKPAAPAPEPAAAPAPQAAAPVASGPTIDAPLNGTFYASSGPGNPAFVKEGDSVKAGETVCIVEAMKLFNQIKAPYDCKIVKFLVEHGKQIKKGQQLIQISK